VRVFISKAFSTAILNLPRKEKEIFNEKVDILKNMTQKDITESDAVIKLIDKKDLVVYAYNIQASVYVLFTFKEKNKIILLDEIELINDNEIKSLVYSDVIAKSKKDDEDD
jgi:mRNA-degrading endonuclease RelE of RelBE toxin-antitoxin system